MNQSEIESSLALAESYFKSKNYACSEDLLKKIIRADSNNTKANELLAYIYGNQGKLEKSFDLLTIASEAVNCSPEALYYLGSLQLKRSLYTQAIDSFQKCLNKAGNFFEGLHDMGTAYACLGESLKALAYYQECLKFKKDSYELQFNIGRSLDDLKRYDEALSHYDQAITLKPDYAEAYSNKGITLHELRRYDEALSHYDQAIALKPGYAEAWSSKGITLHELKRYDEALSHYDQAIALKPGYAEVWSSKGITLHELKRYDEALSHYDQAIALKPGYAEAWSNKGALLHELKRYDEALSHYDQAIALKPDYAEAYSNKGNTLHQLNRYDEALNHYNQAITFKPQFFNAHYNKSITCLSLGDFDNGWTLYEYRWQLKDNENYRHNKFKRLKSLDDVSNKNILIWHEQGYGDTIQFSRYVSNLIELGAKVTFEIQEELINLFRYNFCCDITSKIKSEADYDFQSPLLNLPRLFSTQLSCIPSTNLKIRNEDQKKWENQLNLSRKRINIGVAISGNPNHKNNNNRSLQLKYILPLLDFGNIYLIQKQVDDNFLSPINNFKKIINLGDQINDFVDTAAIIMNMDLIISVDTSLIHLSGSLNKKSYLMLPWCPEWRWLHNRTDSPWYPSIKIFRQQSPGDWGSVIDQISIELKKNFL